MTVRFLVNPSAGGGTGDRALPAIRARLPPGADLVVSGSAGELTAAARQAVGEAVDRLVVAGGDGTFHRVLPALAGADTALGLLPVGRGNDLATCLGIPAALDAAVELALAAPVRTVDLGRAGGRWFGLYAGVGFDSAVSATADRQSRRLPASITYVLATLRTLIGFRPPSARLEWDGGSYEGEVMFATACNGPRFGGGMLIAPEAAMDDGLLDLVIVRRVAKAELLRVFPRVFRGTHVDHPAISIHRTRRVRMRFTAGSLLACDGEVLGTLAAEELAMAVVPGALKVALSPRS